MLVINETTYLNDDLIMNCITIQYIYYRLERNPSNKTHQCSTDSNVKTVRTVRSMLY